MKRANDFVVGLTILLAIVIVTGATLWVKQTDLGRRKETVIARFRDVGNVRVGAQVVIRGVAAGRIEGLQLAKNGWVEAKMRLDPSAAMPRDPVVLLNESSLFGEWQATILERAALPRDEEVARQIREADLKDGAIPGATLPDIAQLTAVAGRIAGDVAAVAGRVDLAFDERAARELRGSIKNFSDLSAVLAQSVRAQSKNLDSMSAEVRGGVNSLVHAAQDVQAISARFDSSTSRGEIRQIIADAATSAKEMREASNRILKISERLGDSQARLESFLTHSDSVMTRINRGDGSLGLLVNDPSLYRSTDSLMRELRELVVDMKKNPKKYVNVRVF